MNNFFDRLGKKANDVIIGFTMIVSFMFSIVPPELMGI